MVYVCTEIYFMQSCTHSLPFWLLLNTVCYNMLESLCYMLSQSLCVCVCELTGYIITDNAYLMLHCRKKAPAVKTPRKGGKQSGKSPVQQVGIVMYQDTVCTCTVSCMRDTPTSVVISPTSGSAILSKCLNSHHWSTFLTQSPSVSSFAQTKCLNSSHQFPAVCCCLLPSSSVTSEWTEFTCYQVGVLCRCAWCPLSTPSHGHEKLVQHVHSFATVLRTCPKPIYINLLQTGVLYIRWFGINCCGGWIEWQKRESYIFTATMRGTCWQLLEAQ